MGDLVSREPRARSIRARIEQLETSQCSNALTCRWKLNRGRIGRRRRSQAGNSSRRKFAPVKTRARRPRGRRRHQRRRRRANSARKHLSNASQTNLGLTRSSRQTEANQTKPKAKRERDGDSGTNQLSQAHPQLAKRQTYLIQLLVRAHVGEQKKERRWW